MVGRYKFFRFFSFFLNSGDNVRLRIIHGGYENPLLVHVEGHRFQVIAADGSPVRPVMVCIAISQQKLIIFVVYE